MNDSQARDALHEATAAAAARAEAGAGGATPPAPAPGGDRGKPSSRFGGPLSLSTADSFVEPLGVETVAEACVQALLDDSVRGVQSVSDLRDLARRLRTHQLTR
jgi:hypothetical protein